MGAGQGAVGDAVAVDIVVAAEFAGGFELVAAEHLAAIVGARIVPAERRA